ncbi:MAG: hypothetical protein ABI565_04220 [Vicinamibacteria bacterium]
MSITREIPVLAVASLPSAPSVPRIRIAQPPVLTREFLRRPAGGWLESAPISVAAPLESPESTS